LRSCEQGWGFIECAETEKHFGGDVFLLKNDLNGFGVCKGDEVTFSVTQSERAPGPPTSR